MPVTKKYADQWTVRTEEGQWLATIFMDDTLGLISIYSDYGNYGYLWSQSGRGRRSLREFLSTISSDYVMNKFSYGSPLYVDTEATLREIKKDLITARREGKDKNLIRELWEELSDLEDFQNVTASEWQYGVFLNAGSLLEEIYSGSAADMPCITTYHPQLKEFMKRVWPIFMKECPPNVEKKETTV